jgi:alkylated DNA repair dioxygenase AlkB
MMALQGSLLDLVEQPGLGDLGDLGEHLCRTQLSAGAWIEHVPGWMTGSDTVFERLRAAVPWKAERRRMYDRMVDVPRLLCFYGEEALLPDPVMELARGVLSDHFAAELGEPLCTAGMCLYRDGSDSVAWHGDTIGRGAREDTIVAIVSLGAPRGFLLRPIGGGPGLRFELGRGDLFVMGGSCQRTWQHAVPKTTRPVGPRLSVQFRPRGVR